ncbi:hypothetical protein C9I92_23245 [Photobacterium ganghwense]|uniref:Uncharacterized protein n=1 Tax=Photobacterium ganghwense TaxID=320778 RepID=A0A0J1K5R5_9GAMM|nr:DUF6387 family protein [Photobacterium ganghwense]KLV09712.1 hypothetical protein ABT57_10930 [Photobacterium ganghwense]PSU04734.1 hypothetical protein C9I92_23245 [Photobacterium ganghwense]
MPSTKRKSIRNTNHDDWPSWFNIRNYDQLNSITIGEFLNELDYRLTLHERIPQYCRGRFRENGWTQITRGNPIVSSCPTITRASLPLETNSVHVMKRIDLETLTMMKDANDARRPPLPSPAEFFNGKVPSPDATREITQKEELERNRAEYQMPFNASRDSVLLSIDLENANDQQILKDIAYLLPQLREKLRCPEKSSDDKKHDNLQTLKKIIEYKAIAFLDLDFYFLTHPNNQLAPLKPSASLLSRILFDGEKDEYQVKRTIRPYYANTVLNTELMNRLFSKIREDKSLLSRKVLSL